MAIRLVQTNTISTLGITISIRPFLLHFKDDIFIVYLVQIKTSNEYFDILQDFSMFLVLLQEVML